MGKRQAIGSITVLSAAILWIMASLQGQEPEESRRSKQTLPSTNQIPSTENFTKSTGNLQRYQGTGSCSAVACHGGVGRNDCNQPGSAGIWKSEYTVWMTDDPHSRAFTILYDELATRIATNLAQGGQPTPAWQDVRCLSCHTLPRSESELAATTRFNADGVGCESCHGPASNWIGQHTTTTWRSLDPQTKERDYQFTNTKNLVKRTEVCTGCHVGKRGDGEILDRDMNHDMIAAGHPRLAFEMASYSDLQANHWCEKPEKWTDTPTIPTPSPNERNAWLWATGRLVTAASSLELSASRAESKTAPWPEFSENNCYSCHQELTAEPAKRKLKGELAGRPAWGSWFMTDINPLIQNSPTDIKPRLELMENLEKLMQLPLPDRQKVTIRSRSLSLQFKNQAFIRNESGISIQESKRILDQNLGKTIDLAPKAWDHEAQRYLTISALARSHDKQLMTPEVHDQLELLKVRLQTPAGASTGSHEK